MHTTTQLQGKGHVQGSFIMGMGKYGACTQPDVMVINNSNIMHRNATVKCVITLKVINKPYDLKYYYYSCQQYTVVSYQTCITILFLAAGLLMTECLYLTTSKTKLSSNLT